MQRLFPQQSFYTKQVSVLISNMSPSVTMDDLMRLFSNYEMHSNPVSLHMVGISYTKPLNFTSSCLLC